MDGLLVFLTVFVTLASSVCTAVLVPFRQYRLRVEPRFFKRVKVKFLSFLFAGVGGSNSEQGDVKNFGVIVPMFVLHIIGYALTLLICAIVPTLYYAVGLETDVLFVIPLGIALVYVIAVVITEYMCVRFSRNMLKQEQGQHLGEQLEK